MKLLIAAAVAASALSLGACTYVAPVDVSPNLNVYTSYGDKLPGSYALYVSGEGFSQRLKPTGINCAAHTFPLDVQDAFKQSAIKTLQQLVENVEVVDAPMTAESLARAGKQGQIIIRADTMTARLQFIPGFWSSTAEANVELSAALSVDNASGRVLGTTAEGSGISQGGSGSACAGGANALGEAAEKAMKQLLGQLGERLANSPRIRAPGRPNG